jgi:two-component system, OmpR family, sensor kinase
MKLRLPGLPRWALLRTRVLAGVLLVTLVVLAAFDVAAVSALRPYLLGQTDVQLRDVLNLYGAVARDAQYVQKPLHACVCFSRPRGQTADLRRTPLPAHWLSLPAPFLRPYTVVTVSGKIVKEASPVITIRGLTIGNAGLMAPRMPGNLTTLARSGMGWTTPVARGQALRMMAAPDPGHGVIVVMTSLDSVDKTVGQLELILVIGSAAAALFAAGGVAWIMRRGLRPIETMAGQADAITAGDLASRVGPHDPRTEVGRLGVALNGMLSRIEEFITERETSQEATRRFFADASHELRTPLASLRANAELYQQGVLADRSQVDEAMRRITLEAKRMSGLVDDMFRLARLDQQPSREHEPVDLSAVLRGCAERARIADPHRTWRASIAAGLVVAGDEELLRRAADNLLANISTHTPAGTVATIRAAESDGTITVQVGDDGPGLPASQLPRIFDRFYRAAPPGCPGSGLGLAIVTAVAATHGGTVAARLNETHGLQVILTLPAASPAPAQNTTEQSRGDHAGTVTGGLVVRTHP